MRNEFAALALAIALVVGLGAGYLGGSYGTGSKAVTTTITKVATANQQSAGCTAPSSLPVLPVYLPGFSWAVHYSGSWNATVEGITGNGSVAFSQCYSRTGDGYAYVSSWTSNGGVSLVVTAHKMDSAGGSLLSVAVNGNVANTTAPYGAASVEAYIPVGSGTSSSPFMLMVNGTMYFVDDVSSDIVVQNPGYGYFDNGSVSFDGVVFTTICLPQYSGCPVPPGTTVQNRTMVMAGAMEFNMTFSGGHVETSGGVIGDSTYLVILSQHANPRAGMLVEYVDYNYPHNFPPYHVFLLVSR